MAYYWGTTHEMGGVAALTLAIILSIMEVSLSFDNAVVNATVLKEMNEKWQRLFLTVGILIAVFGMRMFFPIAIVAIATGLGLSDVAQMALNSPAEYARHLTDSHVSIAAFGGMFLLLVFLGFLFDEERELHWLGKPERLLSRMGKMESISILVALIVLALANYLVPEAQRHTLLLSGLTGIILFVAVNSLDAFFEDEEEGEAIVNTAKRSGVMGFIYLEILDASFSFDGVIGAFAVTQDIVIIMLGLTIGAMFVRSMTIYLVKKGTLDEYVYLEHGAHYAIGVLAFIMLISIVHHVPEIVTGLTGVAFIVVSLYSSIKYKKKLTTA
jgi:hypothetical protein